MTPLKRRCWYAGLFIAWALLLTIANPNYEPFDDSILPFAWQMAWSGAFLLAGPFLVAVWLALGVQPAVRRIPLSLAVAAFFVLLTMAGRQQGSIDAITTPLIVTVALVTNATALVMLRKWLRWRVGIPGATRQRNQFTIVAILCWTAGVAGLLGFANVVIDGSSVDPWRQGFFTFKLMFRLSIMILVYSLIALPVAVAAAGAVLADWRRRRFIGWLIALCVCYAIGLGAFMYLLMAGGGAGPREREAPLIPLFLILGLLAAILGTLGVLRHCGFRLWREESLS